MFGRRVPPHIVFYMSLLMAVLCGVGAFLAFRTHSWVWLAIAGILAVWFAIDAIRAYSWKQNKTRLDAEKAQQK